MSDFAEECTQTAYFYSEILLTGLGLVENETEKGLFIRFCGYCSQVQRKNPNGVYFWKQPCLA
jgi:hypothetical protein